MENDLLYRLAIRNLFRRPLRYALTGLAILFSVASVTAVCMFIDGLRAAFLEVSNTLEAGYDVAVRSESPFGNEADSSRVPVELADELRAVDGVEFVQPRVVDFTVVAVDADGNGALANNAPNVGMNWELENPVERFILTQGRRPNGGTEFAIDSDTFADYNFTLENLFTVNTPSGSKKLTLVGVFDYGSEKNETLGAKIVAFDDPTAVELLNNGNGYDDMTLGVVGETGSFIDRLQPALDDIDKNLKALSRDEVQGDQEETFQKMVELFQTVLLVFAGIVLMVSSLLVYNVFNITLEQRIKELGVLRAIGASGSQITRMMITEALTLSILATIAGIIFGRYLASLLRYALAILGFPGDLDLPLSTATLAYAIIVGIGTTQLASIWPAVRARRISPMAAISSPVGSSLEIGRNISLGALCLVLAGGLTRELYSAEGWFLIAGIPLLTAIFLYVGFRWLGRLGRFAAPYATLGYGIWLLVAVWLSAYSLSETFALLAVGAAITIMGLSRVSAVSAKPFSYMAGHYPTAFVVWVCAIISALIAGIISPGSSLADWSQSTAPGYLFLLTILLVILSYGLLRTTRGSFGITGRLARQNAARNPQRTASTSVALMIGLALMTATTVIGDSIKSSVALTLGSAVTADWFIQGPQTGEQGLPFSSEASNQVGELPEVAEVLSYRYSRTAFTTVAGTTSSPIDVETVKESVPELFAVIESGNAEELDAFAGRIGAATIQVDSALGTETAVLERHINPGFVARDDSLATPDTSIFLEEEIALSQNIRLGDPVVAVFLNGEAIELTVTGIYQDGSILGDRVVDFELWNQYLSSNVNSFVTVITSSGVEQGQARAALENRLVGDYPNVLVKDRREVAADAELQIDRTLATVNLLLLVSGGIAILGITIALFMAVLERTREIGMLRAIGTKRKQIRWTVRWEGVIIALFGGFFGTTVGVCLGIVVTQKLPEYLVSTTTIPFSQLFIYTTLIGLSGVLAGVLPAIAAGRVGILNAINSN